jgi:hypothetical protein
MIFLNRLMAMSILEHLKKINPAMWPETYATTLIILLVAFGSFGLGRLSRIEEAKAPLNINQNAGLSATVASRGDSAAADALKNTVNSASNSSSVGLREGFIVASKTSKKYHFPWCPGAQQIKDDNKIWFATVEEAQVAGYVPASNCKGLPQ